jgi:DNA polymerase zeta
MSFPTLTNGGDPVFSLRIVTLDYYMTAPTPEVDVCYSSLEGTAVEQVPVIRIFGSTPGGQRACLHVHKVIAFTSSAAGPDAWGNPLASGTQR